MTTKHPHTKFQLRLPLEMYSRLHEKHEKILRDAIEKKLLKHKKSLHSMILDAIDKDLSEQGDLNDDTY